MIGGVPTQHRWSAQRWANGINLWPNAVLAFNHALGQYTVCLGYCWILINVDKNIWKKLKTEKNKIMICGIHYFITKLKTKIDVILRSRFKDADKRISGQALNAASEQNNKVPRYGVNLY